MQHVPPAQFYSAAIVSHRHCFAVTHAFAWQVAK